jgi:cytochrome c
MSKMGGVPAVILISIVAFSTVCQARRRLLSPRATELAPLVQESKPKQYTYAVNGKNVTVDFPIFVEGSDKKVTKDVFHGYQLYNSYCFRCHGTDATESALAPDLKRFTAEMTQKEFQSVALAGREDQGMPSWAGFLSEEEILQIYQYVKGRSLQLVPGGRPPSEYD